MPKILLVDDDPDFSFALESLLGGDGHAVTSVGRADDALDRARGTPFDVALVDLGLPDAHGFELLDGLASADPLLPVVCLTGTDDTTSVVQAMRRGALDYLTKPVRREALSLAVESASSYSRARREATAVAHLSPVGRSLGWRQSVSLLEAAAATPKTTVLITGEPGVGKEVAATLLHEASARRRGPLITANAACFSPSLMESELFGHEAGAFTGAARRRRGLFEAANGGTLFLDEIGELPLDLQSKLLRVLEGHAFRRVGGEEEVRVDARLVMATNRDLKELVREGKYRADLYERIRGFEVRIPPLRERVEDIPVLAHFFVEKLSLDLGRAGAMLTPEATELLVAHAWPGNVRELRNTIERAIILAGAEPIAPRHLPSDMRPAPPTRAATNPRAVTPVVDKATSEAAEGATLDDVTRQHIESVFRESGSNVTRAAEKLGMSRLTLRKKLQAYGLRPVKA